MTTGCFLQRDDGGARDERHVRQLDAVALLVLVLLFLAQLDDARHVHLEDGVDVRAGALRLDHALRDDGAHLGHRDKLARQRLRRLQQRAWRSRRRCSSEQRRQEQASRLPSRWPTMSLLVMRPAAPVPGTWCRSTLLSFAILRTSGEERTSRPRRQQRQARPEQVRPERLRVQLRLQQRASQRELPAAAADHGDDGVDRDGAAFGHLDLGERAGDGRRNLGVNFVGRDLEDRLVALDGVADLLEPLGDGALGDGLAHLRHHNFGAGTACGGAEVALVAERQQRQEWWSRAAGAAAVSAFAGAAWRARRWSRASFVDGADDGVDLHGRAFSNLDLLQRAGGGRRNLGVDLVGRDLEERLVALDGVARLLEPLGDGAFGDGFAHLGHDYIGRHEGPFGCCLRLNADVAAQLWIIRRRGGRLACLADNRQASLSS